MRGLLTAILAGTVSLTAAGQNPASAKLSPGQANAALQAGEADKALSILASLNSPQAQMPDARGRAQVHNLSCRVYLILERWDNASGECEQAVRLDSGNGLYHMWYARALGERASRASFLSAYSLSKKLRAEYEEAARLAPGDPEVLADLGEFYFEAPGVVGGGQDKAQHIADQMESLDKQRALELRAKIADQHKDTETAERLLHQAVSSSPHPAFQWLGLAAFYQRHQRWQEMESALNNSYQAVTRDRRQSTALFGAANMLIQTRRNPQLAARMLEEYLSGPVKTEEAPAFIAHLRLAKLKEQMGDATGGQQHRMIAHSLAHDYQLAEERRH